MVQIHPAAAQELKRLLEVTGVPATGDLPTIYLSLEPGGCADWTYRLSATAASDRPTTTLGCGDLNLRVPTDQIELIQDLTLDYAEDLMGGGFRFINPLAQRTCGCGNAFALSANAPVTEDCSGFSPLGI
jgi:iron-sulfur cluster assembly protein